MATMLVTAGWSEELGCEGASDTGKDDDLGNAGSEHLRQGGEAVRHVGELQALGRRQVAAGLEASGAI